MKIGGTSVLSGVEDFILCAFRHVAHIKTVAQRINQVLLLQVLLESVGPPKAWGSVQAAIQGIHAVLQPPAKQGLPCLDYPRSHVQANRKPQIDCDCMTTSMRLLTTFPLILTGLLSHAIPWVGLSVSGAVAARGQSIHRH